MKVLCICEHGNVRSVALAYLIKTIYKHEAIAIGWATTSDETRLMLYDWADMIVGLVMPKKIVRGWNVDKFRFLDVGPDVWHDPFNQELQHKLLRDIGKLKL